MSQQLYTASRIAEFCGITKQYVNRYCKAHCPEARTGTKIDISHPVMIDFLESKNVDLTKELRSATARTSHLASTPVSQSERKNSPRDLHKKESQKTDPNKKLDKVDISDHGHLTINELTAFFGDAEQYRSWLTAKKTQVEVIERELKVKERLGELISREIVKKAMIGLVDGFTSRLLTDFCKSSPIDLRAAIESGKDNIEVEKLLKKLLTQQLEPVIKKVAEVTRD